MSNEFANSLSLSLSLFLHHHQTKHKIGGTPPATAARKKKLRHNKPTPPERREQELSMSVDYIMDSLETPEGIVDPEKSFSDYFHWMPEGKVEICEPYWGSVKVHEEWLDHFPEAEICGTQNDNVCYETDLSCRKQEDGKHSCVTVAKPVDTICGTQEDVCHEKEKTCQYDEDEADNTLTCQTVSSSIGTFCDTNACLDKQACDGSGNCAGGQDNCPYFGTECGGTCKDGTCSFHEAKSCTKDKCSEDGFCNGVGLCDAEPKDCDDDNTCTNDSCDLDTGLCAFDPVDDGTDCDSLPGVCFDNQVCKKGKCVGEDICPGFGTTCGGKCDLGTKVCVFPNDGNACDKDKDLCLPGVCAGGDADEDSGTCVVSSPKCVQDENPCTVNECDSITGDCKSHDVENGSSCDRFLPGCFANQVCTNGKCGGEDTCVAEKGSPCGGTCSASGDCEYTYPEDEVECWDIVDGNENFCRPGYCSQGTCDYEEKVCDERTCEVGTCLTDLGTCKYDNAEEGTNCDTIPCFDDQKCDDNGKCMTTGVDNCPDDDEDECTFPTCEATNTYGTGQEPIEIKCTGIGYKNSTTSCNTTACFDNQMCDGQGTCMDGEDNCDESPLLPGTDGFGDDCYGTCDKGSGSCTNYTKTDDDECSGPCDEEGSGYCSSGSCTNTTDKDCNPTDDVCYATCDGFTGNCDDFDESDENECDDTLVCTKGDVCSGGKCEGNFTCGDGELNIFSIYIMFLVSSIIIIIIIITTPLSLTCALMYIFSSSTTFR